MQTHFQTTSDMNQGLLDSAFLLIASGGEVRKETLWDHLLKVALLGYVLDDSKIIATAAIKRPMDTYADSVFTKAMSDYDYNDFNHELGYVVIDPDFRNKRIASRLCEQLCERFFHCSLYATVRTNNPHMLSILYRNGFTDSGNIFKGRVETDCLKLLIRLKRSTIPATSSYF